MNRTEKFIQLYTKLEQIAVLEYGFPKDGKSITRLMNLKCYKDIRRELAYCKEIRNILQHNPKINNEYTIELNEAILALLESIIKKIELPKKVVDFYKPISKIISAHIGNNVMEYMQKMEQNQISYIPILDDKGFVRGVFGESTVFQCVLDEGINEINENTKFYHIKKYLSLDNTITGSFIFTNEHTLMIELENILYKAYKSNKRIGVIFITKNGKENERLMGLITPYDIIGN